MSRYPLDRVLGLQRRHWNKLNGALNEERPRDMVRGAAQVTVVRGVPSRGSAERLLMADDFYQGQRAASVTVDAVFRNLSHVYASLTAALSYWSRT